MGAGNADRRTFEKGQRLQQLLLVVLRERVDVLVLVEEAVAAPDQRAVELLGPAGWHLGGQATGGYARGAPSQVLFLVDRVADVGRLGRGIELGLLGADAVDVEPSAKSV
jgi:hypothetical protein